MRIDLQGGSWAPRSTVSGSQRCINVYPEKPRKDSGEGYAMVQRPGLRRLGGPPAPGVGRGIFRTSQGYAYSVVGQTIYSVDLTNWQHTVVGQLESPLTNLCSLTDNGTSALLVDGSASGYSFEAASGNNFAQVVDPTGIFAGSIKVDYVDTFVLWTLPKSIEFGSTLSNSLTFDPLYVAGKTGYPDLLQSIYVNKHLIVLFGQVRSEIWYNAGNPLFPFALLPGAYIEWGALAPYSIADVDNNIFWLAQGKSGVGLVCRQRGYETRVISNYALSYAIGQMQRAGADLSDAIAYCYTQEGHIFYVLTFVSGNQTWVYDESIADPEAAWHQRGFTSPDGLQRERACSHALLAGLNVVQDWQNGDLYALDLDYYYDHVNVLDGQGLIERPVAYTRTLPQLLVGMSAQGPVAIEGKRVRINSLSLDMDCGNGPEGEDGRAPSIGLRLSFDRGKSWGSYVLQSTGRIGEYGTLPKWAPLGIGRWPTFELQWSFAGKSALGAGFVDLEVLAS